SAARPFSADATLCPCCSSERVSSSRLTLLSSTTRRRALEFPPSRILELRQRRCDLRILGRERVELCVIRLRRVHAGELELARHRGERECAERVAVRLERMRGAPERVGFLRRERAAKLVQHRRTLDEEGVDELDDEIATGGVLEFVECGAIDRGCGHVVIP